jgi:hypothetical protein
MTPSALAVIGATIVFSSFVSGVFGMAGGMVLLGVLLAYFDVATGMILFSIIQFFANGWRVVQWRQYVLWPIFGWYLVGAVISFAVMWTIAFVPDKAMVYLLLGLIPFAVEALPAALRPNIEWRGVPFFTGVVTTIIQILSRRRAVSRRLLPEEHARPQDHQRHQGGRANLQSRRARALFRLARGRQRSPDRGHPAGDPARHRRHLVGALRDRAHDRPRLSAVVARGHLRDQRGLSRPRRLAVLARLSG